MDEQPILQNRFEVGVWKKLSADVGRFDRLMNIVDSVIGQDEAVSSSILVKLIDLMQRSGNGIRKDMIIRLESKRRSSDANPTLAAALAFLEMKDIDTAVQYAESIKNGNIPLMCCVRAKICIAGGDLPKAKKFLMRARCSNPLYSMFYDLIQQIEPTSGWMFRRNIELLVNGEEPVACGSNDDSSSPEVLFEIYRDWYRGRRDDATRTMINSEEYRKKNSEFVLASARMSMDEKDWHSAQMMYDLLLEKSPNCVYILCEAADAYYRNGDFERALQLYRDAEALDPRSRQMMRGLIHTYSALDLKGEAVQCLQEYMDTEDADLKVYRKGAKLLAEWGNLMEASVAISKILTTYPNDKEACMLGSSIELSKGNPSAALDLAANAMRNNPSDIGCRVQYARILFGIGKTDRALRELEKVEREDADNIDALLLFKDIRIDQKDYPEVVRICEEIILTDPGNREAAKTLSDMLVLNDVPDVTFDSYKGAVGSDVDPRNTIDLVSALIREGKYREAADLCYTNDSKFSDSVMIKRLRGNAEYSMGEYLHASASFAEAVSMDPNDPILWYSKGMADEMHGDLDSAEEAFNKAILMDMDQPEFWLSRSSVREKKGDLEGAVESLNRVIELRPDMGYALVRKAMMFARVGKFDEALCYIDMANVTDHDNHAILGVERDICIAAGYYDRAVKACKAIIKGNPKDPDAVDATVRAYHGLGRDKEAMEVVDGALFRDPKSVPLLLIKKEFCISSGDLHGAIDACGRILDMQPDNRLVKSDLADLYANTGDVQSANRIYSDLQYSAMHDSTVLLSSVRTAETDADDARANYKIGLSMFNMGDMTGAKRMAERAIALSPKNTDYIILMAKVYEKSGDTRSAEAFITDVIKRNGVSLELLEVDGDLRLALNDDKGALKCYEDALACGRPNSAIHIKRGAVQEKMGHYDQAVMSFVSAIVKDPKSIEAYQHLAVCQLRLGKIVAAEKSIETIMASDSSARTLIIRSQIFAAKGDKNEVMDTYRMFLKCKDADATSRDAIVAALKSVGLNEDAEGLVRYGKSKTVADKKEHAVVPDRIKRYSERVLRRAYTTGMPLSDHDLVDALDFDDETSKVVMEYLSDIAPYGDILPGTQEFERMEKLSVNAIIKGDCTGLSEDPVISIPCAYVAGGTRDADEAKRLVAYIYKVMTSKSDSRRITAELRDSMSVLPKGMSAEDVVKSLQVGIYYSKLVSDNL